MTDIGEGIKPPASGRHNKTCPICEGKKNLRCLGYNTKLGVQKDEKVLGQNLRKKGQITSDKAVGNVFPFAGGRSDHKGWVVKAGVMQSFEVTIQPTPHHLIPGNAAMAPSKLEKWTSVSKNAKLKEDVGYSIDCTRNGIWLPHLPHIHWTSYKTATKRWCDIYGKWSKLDFNDQLDIGRLVMGETSLQMHYTDHDDPYADVPHNTTYDNNAKQRCNTLAALMLTFWDVKCPEGKDPADNNKMYPPYGLVERINLQSDYMKKRISGHPSRWKEFVSPLATELKKKVKGGWKIKKKGVVTRA
jgi:hypothetical protein